MILLAVLNVVFFCGWFLTGYDVVFECCVSKSVVVFECSVLFWRVFEN